MFHYKIKNSVQGLHIIDDWRPRNLYSIYWGKKIKFHFQKKKNIICFPKNIHICFHSCQTVHVLFKKNHWFQEPVFHSKLSRISTAWNRWCWSCFLVKFSIGRRQKVFFGESKFDLGTQIFKDSVCQDLANNKPTNWYKSQEKKWKMHCLAYIVWWLAPQTPPNFTSWNKN